MSPVAGSAPGNSHKGEGDGPPPLTAADFQIDVTGEQATVCPAGHPSIEEHELEDAPEGRGTEEWRKRYAIRGRDRGNELRAQARPRPWALAGARGPSGAACRLPEDVGVQLQADGHARLVEMDNTAHRAVGTVPAVAAA